MVHIKDDGIFEEPLDKIWKYLNDPKAPHNHRLLKSQKVIEQKGNILVTENTMLNPDGKGTHTERWKLTFNAPKGFDTEYLTGPMAGSKSTQTYVPLGASKVKAEVAGEYKIQGMDDAGTKKAVLSFLEEVWKEDVNNLKQYK